MQKSFTLLISGTREEVLSQMKGLRLKLTNAIDSIEQSPEAEEFDYSSVLYKEDLIDIYVYTGKKFKVSVS